MNNFSYSSYSATQAFLGCTICLGFSSCPTYRLSVDFNPCCFLKPNSVDSRLDHGALIQSQYQLGHLVTEHLPGSSRLTLLFPKAGADRNVIWSQGLQWHTIHTTHLNSIFAEVCLILETPICVVQTIQVSWLILSTPRFPTKIHTEFQKIDMLVYHHWSPLATLR